MSLTKKQMRIKRKASLIKSEQKNKQRNKTYIKKIKYFIRQIIICNKPEDAKLSIANLQSTLNKAKMLHIIHSNKASRIMSKYQSYVNMQFNTK